MTFNFYFEEARGIDIIHINNTSWPGISHRTYHGFLRPRGLYGLRRYRIEQIRSIRCLIMTYTSRIVYAGISSTFSLGRKSLIWCTTLLCDDSSTIYAFTRHSMIWKQRSWRTRYHRAMALKPRLRTWKMKVALRKEKRKEKGVMR